MYFDLLLLILVGLFVTVGFVKGFTHQFLSFVILLGVCFASHPLAIWVKQGGLGSSLQEFPFYVLWSAAALIIWLLGSCLRLIVSRVRKLVLLSPLDRWMGFAFGTLQGVLIATLIALAFQLLPEDSRKEFSEIDRDLRDSKWVSASSEILNWDFLSIAKELREIQKKLHESSQSLYQPGTPWDFPFGIDKE